jgi:hypothetical protein
MKTRAGWFGVIAPLILLGGVLMMGGRAWRGVRSPAAAGVGETPGGQGVAAARPSSSPIKLAPGGDPASIGRPIPALQFVSDLHRDVCACTDRACLDAVNDRYGALAGQQARLEAADTPAYLDVSRSTAPCIQRILDGEDGVRPSPAERGAL